MTDKSPEYLRGYTQATEDWAEVLERISKRPDIALIIPDLIKALKKQVKQWQQEALK